MSGDSQGQSPKRSMDKKVQERLSGIYDKERKICSGKHKKKKKKVMSPKVVMVDTGVNPGTPEMETPRSSEISMEEVNAEEMQREMGCDPIEFPAEVREITTQTKVETIPIET